MKQKVEDIIISQSLVAHIRADLSTSSTSSSLNKGTLMRGSGTRKLQGKHSMDGKVVDNKS